MKAIDRTAERALDRAAEVLGRSRACVALTGAGISVPSGIPDFHSPGGLWSTYDPNEVASISALRVNPKGVWEFLLEAGKMMGRAEPNPAHLALAELESDGPVTGVVTQNIDGLHQAAGSGTVVEFHGGMSHFYCMSCKRTHPAAQALDLGPDDIPWMCSECGGVVRPDVVFYGEGIPPGAMENATRLANEADACLIVGTSGIVAPFNLLPHRVKSHGGAVLEINLGSTAYDGFSDVRIDLGAEFALPEILRRLGA